MSRLEQVFVALDNMEEAARDQFMETLGDAPVNIKLGLEFFSQLGPQGLIDFQKRYQKNIFFDYKLHDIPNTVAKAIKSLEGLPIKYLTIHLTGGREMVRAAMEAKSKYLPDTKVLGVSFLTSLGADDFNELWDIDGSKEDFGRLFKMGLEEKIDGFILSPHELPVIVSLEENLGLSALKVTPGIRFSDQASGDQKRVSTPRDAFGAGADFLVMGRSLTGADDLKARLDQI